MVSRACPSRPVSSMSSRPRLSGGDADCQDSSRPSSSPSQFDEHESDAANGFEEMDESHGSRKRSYVRSFPQTYALADQAVRLSKWLTQDGRFVSGNRELLDQFCARVIEAGVPLSRAWLHIRTLHPEFAGVWITARCRTTAYPLMTFDRKNGISIKRRRRACRYLLPRSYSRTTAVRRSREAAGRVEVERAGQ